MGQSNKREACPTKTDNNVTIVFMSAKRGGILQCSGFLTLKSLLALSQTCKAHTIDASSLVMLIENEVTRDHGVRTVDEAIAFWKDVYIAFGITALHNVVRSGDVNSVKTVLTLCCPESERLKIFGSTIDDDGRTILHHAALLGKLELIEFIVSLLSVDERMFLVMVRDKKLQSVLHVATSLDNFEAITFTLVLLKDTQRFFIVYRKDQDGRTVLHHLALNSQQSHLIETVVSMLRESHRSKAVNIQDRKGATVLQLVSQPLRERSTKMTIQRRAAADGSKFTPTITQTDHLLTLKYSNQHSK